MFAYLGLQNFVATLDAPISAEDVTPPIRFDKAARICSTIGGGNHVYMTLECPGSYEIVKVSCQFGVVVMERGQDGTAAQPFPKGACLTYAWVGAAIGDMVDQALACPRPCVPATIKSGGMPGKGVVGVPYEHRVVISGTAPFALGEMSIPQWLIVELDAGELRFSGVPDAPGVYNVQIPLNSCGELRPFFSECIEVEVQ
jgi:hypothetical protein